MNVFMNKKSKNSLVFQGLVREFFIFNIFINDLEERMYGELFKFVDDIKFFQVVKC